MDALPEVAKSFSYHCSKCDTERYHKVLAHPTPKSAKIQCEICGKKSTFKLPSEKKSKKPSTGAARKAETSLKKNEWAALMETRGGDKTRNYGIAERFKANEKIEHSKFGVGFITNVSGNRVTALFETGEKTLVCAS